MDIELSDERAARNRQLARVVNRIAAAVVDGVLRLGGELAAGDSCRPVVLERGLRVVLEGAAVDDQRRIVVVLDRVEAAVERAAVDGEGGIADAVRIFVAVVPVFEKAGEVAFVLDDGALLNGHRPVVQHGVEAVSAAIGRVRPGLCRALVGARFEGCSTDIVDSGLAVRDVVDGPSPVDDQSSPVEDRVAGCVSDLVAVEIKIKDPGFVDHDVFHSVLEQLHRCVIRSVLYCLLQRCIGGVPNLSDAFRLGLGRLSRASSSLLRLRIVSSLLGGNALVLRRRL